MTVRRAGGPLDADGLDAREAEILRSIIREHIVTGEPIGSRTVSRGLRFDLSAASIRNIMAELEERGYLTQPHASAGRVPTSQAYRLYVDRMIDRPRVDTAQAQEIDRALIGTRGEIAELLGEASRQLSRFSHHVGVVLAPDWQRLVVERLEFVRLDGRRVVAILVGQSGVVSNRILEVDEPLGQSDLDRIGRILSDEFHGLTLPEIRNVLSRRLSEERARYDGLVAQGLELGRRTVEGEGGEAGVFVDGASNLLDAPEFSDPDRVRSLMKALEEKRTLIGLLGRVIAEDGVQVVIGEEGSASGLAQCSVVASSYGTGDQLVGTVGIVGPTRMEYARAIALVDYLARVLSRYFSGRGN